jgi:CRP/FNR family transcriptional regulator, cyclic AMP receptor protein
MDAMDQSGVEARPPTMDQKLELLKQIPLFAQLNDHDLQALGQNCEEIDVPAGKVLASQGHYGSEFFVIVDGTVSVERDGQHLRDLGPGESFGELALIANIARTATATCVTPCRLFVLPAREFNVLRRDHPEIEARILHTMAERLARLEADRPH